MIEKNFTECIGHGMASEWKSIIEAKRSQLVLALLTKVTK